VAWSAPQSYLVDCGHSHSVGDGVSPGGDNSTADSIDDIIDSEQHPGHYPSFIKRVLVGSGKGQFYPSNAPQIDDSSIVAAAGSNGVVVAWHHSALLGDATNSPSNSVQSGLFHGRRERSVSANVSIGQPEAAFLAHSRAVNRLAWHPTGNRPYLLLTASQDGTVKLWDRRASSAAVADDKTSNASLTVPNMRTWFGLGGAQVATNRSMPTSMNKTTSNWHCISTYTPKCEAVRLTIILTCTSYRALP
jgi:WD40 repeat protein